VDGWNQIKVGCNDQLSEHLMNFRVPITAGKILFVRSKRITCTTKSIINFVSTVAVPSTKECYEFYLRQQCGYHTLSSILIRRFSVLLTTTKI